MAEPKTRPTKESVSGFLAKVDDPARRADCKTLVAMMSKATGAKPVMWGPAIVGFGSWTYRYANGKALEWPLAAFSPRKTDLTLYFMPGFQKYKDLMTGLGKYKTGKSCFYVKRLEDVDTGLLKKLITTSVKDTKTMSVEK
jgi:hypothetical protein